MHYLISTVDCKALCFVVFIDAKLILISLYKSTISLIKFDHVLNSDTKPESFFIISIAKSWIKVDILQGRAVRKPINVNPSRVKRSTEALCFLV